MDTDYNNPMLRGNRSGVLQMAAWSSLTERPGAGDTRGGRTQRRRPRALARPRGQREPRWDDIVDPLVHLATIVGIPSYVLKYYNLQGTMEYTASFFQERNDAAADGLTRRQSQSRSAPADLGLRPTE